MHETWLWSVFGKLIRKSIDPFLCLCESRSHIASGPQNCMATGWFRARRANLYFPFTAKIIASIISTAAHGLVKKDLPEKAENRETMGQQFVGFRCKAHDSLLLLSLAGFSASTRRRRCVKINHFDWHINPHRHHGGELKHKHIRFVASNNEYSPWGTLGSCRLIVVDLKSVCNETEFKTNSLSDCTKKTAQETIDRISVQ